MTSAKAQPIYRGWTIPERYESKPSDLDVCACGGPKTKHGAMCIACRRRVGRKARPLADRFWEKASRPEHGCWEWQGARVAGYGRLNVGNRSVLAPRIAWELVFGPIPDGMKVLHRCDNPPCVRTSHLFLGTQADNIHDMMAKGRMSPPPRRVA